jgi:heat shock protein HslJ
MRRVLLAVLMIPTAVAAGCSLGSGGGGTGGQIQGVRWVLTSYLAEDQTMTAMPADTTVDATFEAGQVRGSGGCNTYNGPYQVNGAEISIGPVSSTLKVCAGRAGDIEAGYFEYLDSTKTYTATADTLTLFDASGSAILVYAPGPANPLVGGWDVTGYNNGQGGVVSPIPGTTLTARFGDDGSLSGSAGCNDYNGTYTIEGDAITIGPLATTRKACEEAIMTQEQQFLAALQGSTSYRISGDVVTLVLASGSIGVTLVPAA